MIFNRFKRTNFLSQDTTGDDVIEYDLLLSNWDLFEIKQPIRFDTIKVSDIQRPDVLSYRIYGQSGYWWVLCKFNQIDDVWNDMEVGMDIIIPSVRDIQRYYDNVRRRLKTNV